MAVLLTDQEFKSLDILKEMVFREGEKQVNKWGIQTRTPFEWMTYLTEEIGELAEAISECEYRDGLVSAVIKEAIQSATLALKIAEMYLGYTYQD